MGIKFRCPHGHKLNVKSFLAGKKGVCPKCGTSLRIPFESEASSDEGGSDSDIGAAGQKATNGAGHAGVTPAAIPIGTVPAGMPVGAPLAAPMARVAMPAAAPVAMPAMPAMPVGYAAPAHSAPVYPAPAYPAPVAVPVGAAAIADPIAEAPAATWYVRPPAGGQFGPARGDVMRKWIAEGRVSSDSLVWREGWADWRNAGQLFSNLAAAKANDAPATAAIPSTPRSTRAASRYQSKKKGGSGLAVAFLIILAIVCVILVGVLIYVLTTLK
jgi:hypothetical protein